MHVFVFAFHDNLHWNEDLFLGIVSADIFGQRVGAYTGTSSSNLEVSSWELQSKSESSLPDGDRKKCIVLRLSYLRTSSLV